MTHSRIKSQFAAAIVLGMFGICGWIGGALWMVQAPASPRRATGSAPARRSAFAKQSVAAPLAATDELDANEWVRTRNGWERAVWRAKPRRLPHPSVVATFLCFASLMALVAFSPVGAQSRPTPGASAAGSTLLGQ